MNVEPEYRLVNKMVEHIEDSLFSGPYENIKNWDQTKCMFCVVEAMACAHDISKMTA